MDKKRMPRIDLLARMAYGWLAFVWRRIGDRLWMDVSYWGVENQIWCRQWP